MCAAGSYSEDGVEPTCRKCDYGWYQENQGSNNCTQCPNGTTTFERGSVNSSSCKGMLFPELEVSDVLMRFFLFYLRMHFFILLPFSRNANIRSLFSNRNHSEYTLIITQVHFTSFKPFEV